LALNHGRAFSERQDLPPAQEPDQSSFVIAREPPIRRVRLGGYRRQAEQVAGRPAERLGLRAPLGEEAATVLDSLLPPIVWDQIRAAGFKMLEDATKAK